MNTNAYLESKVLSADPIELIRLLYQGAIHSVRSAREHLAQGAIAERSGAISKAMAIVAELGASLDHEKGGEISQNLGRLYDYIEGRLLEANFHQTDEPLAEVLGLLSTLAEAWQGVRSEVESSPAVEAQMPSAPVWANPFQAAADMGSRAWDG